MQDIYGLTSEEITSVEEVLKSQEEPDKDFSMPLAFYQDWQNTEQEKYLSLIPQRIAILKSHPLTAAETNEYQYYNYIVVKGYPITNNSFRYPGTNIYSAISGDVLAWLRNESILRRR